MIRGIHGLFYSSDPDATRAFFREKVRLPGTDIGQGWWIFDLPEGDLGVHPVEDASEAGTHDVSFYCDDISGTVAEMSARGVRFTKPVEDHGYGFVTYFEAPGGVTVQLYEPRYSKGKARRAAARKAARRPAARKGAGRKRKPARGKTGRRVGRRR
jgi:predicted enzyme related to lactoylglutathione lyase